MWIFDKLFNRKIEGKSSLDDLAENVVVNKETNTTEIGGNLNVSGTITQNSQPIGSGTKLYKHTLFDNSVPYTFILITTNPEPIDFSSIDNYAKFNDYLMSQNVIRFTNNSGDNVQYKSGTSNYFYLIINDGTGASLGEFDDWYIANTTDTVSEL